MMALLTSPLPFVPLINNIPIHSLSVALVHVTHLWQEEKEKQNFSGMASMTMAAASLLPSLAKNATYPSGRRSGLVVVAKASSGGVAAAEGDKPNLEMNRSNEESNGRRELMFVGAAMAACSIATAAMADEPRPGTPEAKKKYAPVCVTMPTARICRK